MFSVLFAIGSLGGGGAERQVLEILKHLDRRRFVPMLYLLSRTGALLSEVPDDVRVFAFSERHTRPLLRLPGWYQRAAERDLAAVLREQQVDVIYDRTYLMTLIAAGATRIQPVPRISVCVVDPEPELKEHTRWSVWLSFRQARRAYAQATCVIANSQGLRDRLIDYFRLNPGQVQVLPNVIDLERVDRLAEAPCSGFEPGCFHIVSVGRLHPQKGYWFLLDALDGLVHRQSRSNLLWHIFGEGPEAQTLQAGVAARGLDRHVRLEGYTPNPFPFLRAAQLFCLPSLYEGLPNVLIEAAACRVPILATDCPSGPREILDGGRVGHLVPPADSPALAAAIDDCIIHYPQWQALADEARRHVEQTYTLASGMAQLESLLEQTARGAENVDAGTR